MFNDRLRTADQHRSSIKLQKNTIAFKAYPKSNHSQAAASSATAEPTFPKQFWTGTRPYQNPRSQARLWLGKKSQAPRLRSREEIQSIFGLESASRAWRMLLEDPWGLSHGSSRAFTFFPRAVPSARGTTPRILVRTISSVPEEPKVCRYRVQPARVNTCSSIPAARHKASSINGPQRTAFILSQPSLFRIPAANASYYRGNE